MNIIKMLLIIVSTLSLCACTTEINVTGNENQIEVSPARSVAPNTNVMNGLSLPGSIHDENASVAGGEK